MLRQWDAGAAAFKKVEGGQAGEGGRAPSAAQVPTVPMVEQLAAQGMGEPVLTTLHARFMGSWKEGEFAAARCLAGS